MASDTAMSSMKNSNQHKQPGAVSIKKLKQQSRNEHIVVMRQRWVGVGRKDTTMRSRK